MRSGFQRTRRPSSQQVLAIRTLSSMPSAGDAMLNSSGYCHGPCHQLHGFDVSLELTKLRNWATSLDQQCEDHFLCQYSNSCWRLNVACPACTKLIRAHQEAQKWLASHKLRTGQRCSAATLRTCRHLPQGCSDPSALGAIRLQNLPHPWQDLLLNHKNCTGWFCKTLAAGQIQAHLHHALTRVLQAGDLHFVTAPTWL